MVVVTPPLPLLQGVARFYQAKKRHVITTQTEHKCVLDSCRVLEAEGFSITYLPVQTNGLLDLEVQMQNIQRESTASTHKRKYRGHCIYKKLCVCVCVFSC